MRKLMLLLMLGIITIGLVGAIINLGNGDYLLTEEEFSQLTNRQIQNYMQSNFQRVDGRIVRNPLSLEFDYSIVRVEEVLVNETNYIKVSRGVVSKPIYAQDIIECLSQTSLSQCVFILRDNPEPYEYIKNGETRTIYSTYYLAREDGIMYYNRAIYIRDNLLMKDIMEGFL